MKRLVDQFKVRLATIDEAFIVSLVLREAFAEYKHLYTVEAFTATTLTPEQIKKRWDEGPVWIVQYDGQVVGTVAAVPKEQSLYIRSMAIRTEARGLGLGKLLLEQVENFARQQGFRRLFLSTTPFLDSAIRLYEQFGFIRVDEGPHELHGTPLFTMEKPVRLDLE